MPHPVIIVEYDPRWPELYEEEKSVVMATVGGMVRSIEHIGSTSVPGLGAKPIIDIVAGVEGPSEADECVALLAGVGYDDVTPQPDNPDWYYCLGRRLDGAYCHLHLMRQGSRFMEGHVLFRDHLRANPDVAREYQELKRVLAERHRDDRPGYGEAKTGFIESVVERARRATPPGGEAE